MPPGAAGEHKASHLIWNIMIQIQRISVSEAYLILYFNINDTVRHMLNEKFWRDKRPNIESTGNDAMANPQLLISFLLDSLLMCFDYEGVAGGTSELGFAWYHMSSLIPIIPGKRGEHWCETCQHRTKYHLTSRTRLWLLQKSAKTIILHYLIGACLILALKP